MSMLTQLVTKKSIRFMTPLKKLQKGVNETMEIKETF